MAPLARAREGHQGWRGLIGGRSLPAGSDTLMREDRRQRGKCCVPRAIAPTAVRWALVPWRRRADRRQASLHVKEYAGRAVSVGSFAIGGPPACRRVRVAASALANPLSGFPRTSCPGF